MISMKIECKDDKVIIYLYQYQLDFDNKDKLNREVKNIFIKLIKKYKMDFFGYSLVHIYENNKYGVIMEISSIYKNEFNVDIIDLKLIIHKNIPFYLELDDYMFDYPVDYFVENSKYYINIKDIDNIIQYIEYGKIVYKR